MNRPDSLLYYEAHVTVDPITDPERLELFERLCKENGFRPAKLFMHKKGKLLELSNKDAFCTGRHKKWTTINTRLLALIGVLRHYDFVIRRYKIEDTLLDSRKEDVFGGLKP